MNFYQFQDFTKLDNYYPYHITLNLTNACNLACRYCFVKQTPAFMPLEIAKQGIDFIWNNLQKHKQELKDIPLDQKCVITLFGGEPLLTFKSVIQPLFIYIEQKYGYKDNFTTEITTNGVLLNQEIIDFFEKYHVNVLFSFDGIKEIQDNNRPLHDKRQSSYEIIMSNYEKYIFYKPHDFMYNLRATADLNHINLWYDNFLFFNSLPIPEFALVVEFYTILNDQQIQQIYQELDKMCSYIYSICLFDDLKKYPKWTNYDHCLGQIITHDYEKIIRTKDVDLNNLPKFITNFCGYALEYVAMDAFGNLYPCREDPAEYPLKCHPSLIGNIKTGIDYEKLLKIKKEVDQLEYDFFMNRTCQKNCWYANNNIRCEYAECPSHAFREKNISTSFCIVNSYLCERIVKDMSLLINEQKVKTYIEYLKNTFPEYKILDNLFNAPPQIQNIMLQELRQQKLIN